MDITLKTCLALIMLALLFAVNAYADDPPPRERGGEPRTPPAEAYTACEGKAAGDSASLQTPQGHKLTGTCQEMDGRLVLSPDGPPPNRGSGRE